MMIYRLSKRDLRVLEMLANIGWAHADTLLTTDTHLQKLQRRGLVRIAPNYVMPDNYGKAWVITNAGREVFNEPVSRMKRVEEIVRDWRTGVLSGGEAMFMLGRMIG